MSFELISRTHLTPQRMFALLQLVQELGQPTRRSLLDLLQPLVINDKSESQEISERLYRAALMMGLLREFDSRERTVELTITPHSLSTFDTFQALMQDMILGVVDEKQDHFLMNQFAAWYAVQDTHVLEVSKKAIEQKFNQDMYDSTNTVKVSDDPGLTAWFIWAAFLGWGWQPSIAKVNEVQFMPDATTRIKRLTARLLTIDGGYVNFGIYRKGLALLCPELDGGVLYEQCWQASRGSEMRGNRLSLMLSTALRTLHKLGEIELINRPDASETWTLFPAQSQISRVSHIRRKAAA